jgi:hypothetical protein
MPPTTRGFQPPPLGTGGYPPPIIQAGDPGAVGPGVLWLNTATSVLSIRNLLNTAWVAVFGAGATISPATTVTGPDTYGDPAVVGVGTNYARDDHDHGGATPNPDLPTVLNYGNDAAGAAGIVNLNELTLVAGSTFQTPTIVDMTASGGAADEVPTAVGDGTWAWGVAPGGPLAAAVAVAGSGQPSAVGVGTDYAKGDHDHGLPVVESGDYHNEQDAGFWTGGVAPTLANVTAWLNATDGLTNVWGGAKVVISRSFTGPGILSLRAFGAAYAHLTVDGVDLFPTVIVGGGSGAFADAVAKVTTIALGDGVHTIVVDQTTDVGTSFAFDGGSYQSTPAPSTAVALPRIGAGVPSGAPVPGENGIAIDTTATTGGVYGWSGAAWIAQSGTT